LGDDLSKRIFENRLLFTITGSYKFIDNTISSSFELFSTYKDKLNSFFKEFGNDIIVYGAGYMGIHVLTLCDKTNVIAFCDSDIKKQGGVWFGHSIISPEKLREMHSNCLVVIAVLKEEYVIEITDKLLCLGIEKDKILNFSEILEQNNIDLNSIAETQYFDPEIIQPHISNDEVFIDAGCCDCLTDFQFIKHCNNEYKGIIAFEPNPKQYPLCVEYSKGINGITIYPYGVWNESADLCFNNSCASGAAHISSESGEYTNRIKAVKLDDILNGEKATFIKMDIEGAELMALKGAEQTITRHHPKLAISVYHKPEDIWEIPAYILSLSRDYKLYLRHYSFWEAETVLYAV